MKHFLYRITNKLNQRYYVGMHSFCRHMRYERSSGRGQAGVSVRVEKVDAIHLAPVGQAEKLVQLDRMH